MGQDHRTQAIPAQGCRIWRKSNVTRKTEGKINIYGERWGKHNAGMKIHGLVMFWMEDKNIKVSLWEIQPTSAHTDM